MTRFRLGAGLISRAAGNLCGRLLRGEPAYPGLPQLLWRFYRSLSEPGAMIIGTDEVVEAAELIEKVGGGRVLD